MRSTGQKNKLAHPRLEAVVPFESFNLWEQIGQSARVPICVFDRTYRLIAFNQAHNDAFFRVNGYYTKIGDVFPDLFVPEQASVMRELMARALTGEIFTVVAEFGNPALSNPCWEISYSPLRDEAGTIVGAFHVLWMSAPGCARKRPFRQHKRLSNNSRQVSKSFRIIERGYAQFLKPALAFKRCSQKVEFYSMLTPPLSTL